MHESKIYKKAVSKGGWIFSKSKNTNYECKWGDLYEYTIKNMDLNGKTVLDIGSAEGLKFMQLSPFILNGIGIDAEKGMIELAEKYRVGKGIDNLKFLHMSSDRVELPNSSFDLITCRHAPFSLKEVKRLLKEGGVFITQQVHELDKKNLKDHFKRGQNYGVTADISMNDAIKMAKELGFSKTSSDFSNLDYYFNSKKHLLDFLEMTPVIPEYDNDKESEILDDFAEKYKTKKGIRTNSARFMIKVEK
jgi:ubiquinone/menaquinone biosynthesis C-methylase UbiE